MRSVIISLFVATSLSGCATVSMVASEALVETNLSAEESSLRKVSNAYTDQAERKNWIAKSEGLLGFARILMDGSNSSASSELGPYSASVLNDTVSQEDQIDRVRSDIESAAHGLDVATMEVGKLFELELKAKALRADLVSYESALVTAKKARRTFITTLAELDLNEADPTRAALAQFDDSIDSARDAADKLADFAANRKKTEAAS
jgi:uncharacterized protein YceK